MNPFPSIKRSSTSSPRLLHYTRTHHIPARFHYPLPPKTIISLYNHNPMDHAIPCNPCIPLYHRNPTTLRRHVTWPTTAPHHSKWRRNSTTSELQLPVEVNDWRAADSGSVPTHKVTVHDRKRGIVHEFFVPEDKYILHTAEDQNINLPFACRHGCCTSCAVRVKSGKLNQPQALGISAELKSKGYALLCVGFPSTDLEVETQDEDEVYWLQFGRYFARGPIERDDYALELALGDE